jgi:hypothetical protein
VWLTCVKVLLCILYEGTRAFSLCSSLLMYIFYLSCICHNDLGHVHAYTSIAREMQAEKTRRSRRPATRHQIGRSTELVAPRTQHLRDNVATPYWTSFDAQPRLSASTPAMRQQDTRRGTRGNVTVYLRCLITPITASHEHFLGGNVHSAKRIDLRLFALHRGAGWTLQLVR